ncbi:hypothetical protein JR316_0013400 [Psilocybe cubensis]|uniref:Uncharacterized protein n=1 Tax=Psilocybe cubensis TaxID=181762 RepID=A0ACB8GFD6_PSICU|nr:uncharacterized protein JR316_0013400 [Psilocybe cubensis]KAH9474237.1 hypothetical protein JR316_0013400 [Psilocybe cubensis]
MTSHIPSPPFSHRIVNDAFTPLYRPPPPNIRLYDTLFVSSESLEDLAEVTGRVNISTDIEGSMPHVKECVLGLDPSPMTDGIWAVRGDATLVRPHDTIAARGIHKSPSHQYINLRPQVSRPFDYLRAILDTALLFEILGTRGQIYGTVTVDSENWKRLRRGYRT